MFFRSWIFQWTNFQVWVLNKNSSCISERFHMKMGKIQKIQIFKNYFWDELLWGWVITLKNDQSDVWEVILSFEYDFLMILNILKIWTFSDDFWKKKLKNQIFKFEEKILIMKISVPICLNEWSEVRSLLKKFLTHYNDVPMTTHKYFQKCSNFHFSHLKFVDMEFFGMSYYDPKSSSIEKYEFFWTFFIFIMSPYLQYFRRYL